jgi:hypothetical protein
VRTLSGGTTACEFVLMSSSGPSTDASVSGVVDQMSGSGDVDVRVASIEEVKVFLYT